ncbi:MAG: sensor histidine kinase [Thermodesulfobacteriota bacterium]|nr:sensor histidine kinase [Thermodesulfobacteriota bacterium]
MTESKNNHSKTGVRFFGEITALLSHDLKNVLAIINENAGLLEDFSLMAAGGNPISPERLGMIAGKIQRQVRRADEMIKRLNRVGHSVDRPLDTVNLAGLVETVCALAARKAALKTVSFSITKPSEPVTVKTDPFALQQLIWVCLDRVIPMVEASKTVEIATTSTTSGATITFGPMEAIRNKPVDTGSESPQKELLRMLNADLITDRNHGTLAVELPLKITA